MPKLFVVSTPIGNLEDITLRALRVLKEASLIAAEDTRVTRKLLSHYDIHTPLLSYYEHNKKSRLSEILGVLQESDVALVSDAGTPNVNDPGHDLVREAINLGIEVVAVPGPSALTSALAICGLPVEQFTYIGFLPRKRTERVRLLESVSFPNQYIIAFETPHRIKAALQDIHETLGNVQIAVCRELTKMYEEVFRGEVSEAIEYFDSPRGEFTLVIESGVSNNASKAYTDDEIKEMLQGLQIEGKKAKESVAQVVEATGVPRSKVYQMWIELK